MESKTKNIIAAVIVVVILLLTAIFFINKINLAKKVQQVPVQTTQPTQNDNVDPAVKAQLDELEKLRQADGVKEAPTPEVVNAQLKELENLRKQTAPNQEVKAPTPEEVQAQLKELEALRKQ